MLLRVSSVWSSCRSLHFASNMLGAILIERVFPQFIAKPRWPIILGLLMAIAAFAMWTQADVVDDYWRLMFPASIIGSAGLQILLLSTMYVLSSLLRRCRVPRSLY